MPILAYALWDTQQKAYFSNTGYYGNELNIKCFPSRALAEMHLETYYRGQPITVKRMRVI